MYDSAHLICMSLRFVTFSRNVFIPLTNICRNRCGYCGFRRDIDHPEAKLLNPAEIIDILERGSRAGCSEALFTFGERPQEVDGFMPLLHDIGYDSMIDYLIEMCRLSLGSGLLPHSNPGVLEKEELKKLKPYNASMGLVLENFAYHSQQGCSLVQAKRRKIECARYQQSGMSIKNTDISRRS